MDVAAGESKITAFPSSAFKSPPLGPAPTANVQTVAKMIDEAKLPVLFLGQRAASTIVVGAVRQFLQKHPIAVVETFQAAGAVSADLADDVYFGRVGLFRNQTGDRVLARSDLILCLGYDPTECKCRLESCVSHTRDSEHLDTTSAHIPAWDKCLWLIQNLQTTRARGTPSPTCVLYMW